MDITRFLAIGIGTQEFALIAIGFMVLFGAKKLPELARGMGEGMREFKKAVRDINADEEPAAAEPKDTESHVTN